MRKPRSIARRDAAAVTAQLFQVRGRFITAIALRLETGDFDAAFYEALDTHLARAPQFLRDAPLILDLGTVQDLTDADRLGALVEELRARELRVFGVQDPAPAQVPLAESLGLIEVALGRDTAAENIGSGTRRADRLLPPDNRVITRPVRSGQVIVAERGDLTVIGSVSSGAELVASGNIHVYGTLRGRAIAGIHGDENARIFCLRQQAELLAIAGLYRTSESIGDELQHQPLQVVLKDDALKLEPLT